MHTTESCKRFQIERVAAHREVGAFHQRKSELSRQIRVLEVRFVERSWCENDCERRFVIIGMAEQLIAQGRKEAAWRTHPQILKDLRKHARDNASVLEGIARTRWGLRSIAQNPPLTIRRT